MLGARRFLLEIPPWVLRRRYLIYSMAPADAFPPYPCRVPFQLDVAREEDIPHLAALRRDLYTVVQLQRRLREGHLAFVGRCGDEIVHQRWVYVNAVYVPYLFHRLVLEPDEGYLDEVYTVPRWRGAGVETAAAYAMQRVLRARGYTRVICSIAAWNLTPRRIAERQGYTRIGTAGYWALPGLRKFFWHGVREDRARNEITVMS
jgi:GNAT superfamily N-acetyltransferase